MPKTSPPTPKEQIIVCFKKEANAFYFYFSTLFLNKLITKMFGMRKWSTPVLRPAAPFIAGGVVVFYLVAKAQDAMINSMFQNV